MDQEPLPNDTFGLIRQEAGRTFALAVPMMAGQVGQMLMGLADTLMVGRLGVTSLAAAAFANGILNVMIVFGIGLTAPVSVLSSQAHGAGNAVEAGEVTRHSVFIAAIAGLSMSALCFAWIFLGGINHMGQAAGVVEEARAFLLVVSTSMAPALIWQVLKQYCEALSRPWAPMTMMGGAVLLNVGLNWVFIFGHFGIPPLGLTGAALGTLTARVAVMCALFVFIRRHRDLRIGLPKTLKRWFAPLTAVKLRTLLALGLPVSLQLVLEVALFALAALMMGWLSPVALAAHQIAITCAATTFMFPLGLGLAVSVRIGQAVGARSPRRTVRAIGFSGMMLAAAIMGMSALMFILFRRQIAALFVHDGNVLALAAELLAVAGVFQIADGVQVVGMSALRGLADVRVPALIALFCYWLVALPTCYIAGFVFGLGPKGIWVGLATGLGFAAISLTTRFHRKT